ncbi:hypothetical protein Pyn_00444 [Prunus yedoensis var. nudiflora]|uniref:Uncharacterized protein n=1 Tax=Prunus yedoensis var. nudiflora TaxID=2094558 RepID=A0A314XK68_PRUYE|nr:hypothetical protein Pyn_00444 [Prunus yedoensis var. nudiflora]
MVCPRLEFRQCEAVLTQGSAGTGRHCMDGRLVGLDMKNWKSNGTLGSTTLFQYQDKKAKT